MERRPDKGGVDQLGGDHALPNKKTLPRPLISDLTGYRALHLIHSYAIRPELASMLAVAVFGGAA